MQTAALTFWAEPRFIDALKAYADERGDLPRAQGAWQADPDERHVDRRVGNRAPCRALQPRRPLPPDPHADANLKSNSCNLHAHAVFGVQNDVACTIRRANLSLCVFGRCRIDLDRVLQGLRNLDFVFHSTRPFSSRGMCFSQYRAFACGADGQRTPSSPMNPHGFCALAFFAAATC